jgi:hypothetical protein
MTNSNWQLYKELELISDADEIFLTQPPTLAARLRHIWRSITSWFQSGDSSLPKIQQVSDAGGTWWYAYDPETGLTTFLESQRDIDMWLEGQFLDLH